jgi:hypothetical protein
LFAATGGRAPSAEILARPPGSCGVSFHLQPDAGGRKGNAEFMRDYPGLTSDEFAAWFPYANPDDGKLVTEALRRAGWQ